MHTIVVARLSPTRTARIHNILTYVERPIADLPTKPFLALKLFAPDLGWGLHRPDYMPVLLAISSEKPKGEAAGCYFALDLGGVELEEPDSKKLSVQPPLPSYGRPLYLHTYPQLVDEPYLPDSELDAASTHCSVCANPSPYKLKAESFQRLCRSIIEHARSKQDRELMHRETYFSIDQQNLEEKAWDSWSGKSLSQPERRSFHYAFDHLPFNPDDLPQLSNPDVIDELLLYNQLFVDFVWPGLKHAISWAENVVLHEPDKMKSYPLSAPAKSYSTYPIYLTEALRESAKALASLQIPCDGEPPQEAPVEICWDADDELEPDFEMVNKTTGVKTKDVRIIVLDLYGTLLDRQGVIREALSILRYAGHDRTVSDGELREYIEYEALQSWQNPNLHLVDLIRATLKEFASKNDIPVTVEVLDSMVKKILFPRLHDGAIEGFQQLLSEGYSLLILPSVDSGSFDTFIKPALPAIFADHIYPLPRTSLRSYGPSRPLYGELLDYCKRTHPKIEAHQILVVATGLYRNLEPANTAGLPTALLRRGNDVESNVLLDTTEPTFVISALQDLPKILKGADNSPSGSRPLTSNSGDSSVDAPSELEIAYTWPPPNIPHLQVLSDHHIIGLWNNMWRSMGSYASLHRLRGGHQYTNGVSVLSYENAVYSLLCGYHAIPRIHWQGVDEGFDILIMDRLGPNLDDLRRLCRRTLSLKTVLMLAEQMISIIEFVHSRGVIFRDVKQDNFAMGTGSSSNILHIFDFGMAKLFVDPTTGQHIPHREGRYRVGTPRYASANAHFEKELSRRDDIEAVGHTLLFLLHGRLPWQASEYFEPVNIKEERAQIHRLGILITGKAMQALLAKSPPEFTRYFDHCRGLGFEEQPDYDSLKGFFRSRMEAEGWEYDWKFDWIDENASNLIFRDYKFEKSLVQIKYKDI